MAKHDDNFMFKRFKQSVSKKTASYQLAETRGFWRGVRYSIFSFLALLMILPVGGYWYLQWGAQPAHSANNKDGAELYDMLAVFGEVFDRVRSDYVDEIPPADLVEKSINGMLSRLDPYSNYFNARDFKEFSEQSRGEFGGIGIEVTSDPNGFVKVIAPIDNTPAARAGVKSGDFITHVNKTSVQGKSLDEVVRSMRGTPGTELTLTFIRQGVAEPYDITLKRQKIVVQSVKGEMKEGFGYVRITGFTEQTAPGVRKIFNQLKKSNGGVLPKGIVIDLRNNPGGLLDQAIELSDDFLDQGEIVSVRGRTKGTARRFLASKGDISEGAEMVVLVNGGSASASEIFAGAMKDQKRAIIIGTKTFGKGVVQSVFPLSKAGTAMKLTTQKYYTPSGKSIHGTGIEPDIEVKEDDVQSKPTANQKTNQRDKQLERALSQLRTMVNKKS